MAVHRGPVRSPGGTEDRTGVLPAAKQAGGTGSRIRQGISGTSVKAASVAAGTDTGERGRHGR